MTGNDLGGRSLVQVLVQVVVQGVAGMRLPIGEWLLGHRCRRDFRPRLLFAAGVDPAGHLDGDSPAFASPELSAEARVGGHGREGERGGAGDKHRKCEVHFRVDLACIVMDFALVALNQRRFAMAHALQPAGTSPARRDDSLTVIALAALLCIAGYVASPLLLGVEMSYAGGAAVVVGIGAVVCAAFRSRAARMATACVVLGLVLIRVASAALPDVFVRPHGIPSLIDGMGMVILLAAAVAMLGVASIRR